MTNIIFEDEYGILISILKEERSRSGVSQAALARRMNRSPTHIHKIESRQRRVEIVEFYRYIKALGGDPATVFGRFTADLDRKKMTLD